MAHLIIDGYNLLPTTRYKDRETLIAALARFRRSRGHEITVVFDGTRGGFGWMNRDFSSGIEVIFSPLTVTADDLIEEMLEGKEASSTIVVSSDRRIQDAARRSRMVFFESADFARRMEAVRTIDGGKGSDPPWMEGREHEHAPSSPKRGPSRKRSKEERRRSRSAKKL